MSTHNRFDPEDEVFGTFLNKTGITPCGHRILIKLATPHALQSFKDKGLFVPENVEDRYKEAGVAAQVIQLGSEAYPGEGSEPWCKPGDWIVLSPYSGTRIHAELEENSSYRIINDDTVQAVIPGPEFVERG